MLCGIERRSGEGIFVTHADRLRHSRYLHGRERIGRDGFGVLYGPACEEVVIGGELMIEAHVALVPVLLLGQVSAVVIDDRACRRERIGGEELRRDRVPTIARNLVV